MQGMGWLAYKQQVIKPALLGFPKSSAWERIDGGHL